MIVSRWFVWLWTDEWKILLVSKRINEKQ